jgi:uncharacterized protein YkwD
MTATHATFTILRARPRVEPLESRELLSGLWPTAQEQLFLEELNDARANPAQYGASIGVDLSGVAPAQPLAFDTRLIDAARLHSQDMNDRAYFNHNTPEGIDPGARISATGFVWTGWGESLAGGTAFPNASDALRALIADTGVSDLGHRRHLLAIDPAYQNQNLAGIGIVQGGSGPLANYYTIDTASALNGGPYLTGTVFNDALGDGKYAIGEGLGNVTITVAGVGSTTTFDTGGYSIAVSPGTYTVTASGSGLAQPQTQVVTVGTTNYRLNFAIGGEAYIQQLYLTILGRTGSTAELQSWALALEGPAGPAGVVAAIEQSPEARTRLVKTWYLSYLGRPAQNGEEQGWVSELLRGVPEETVLATILGSGEFLNRAATLLSAGTANQAYIQTLYSSLLQRTANPGEIGGWLAALSQSGRSGVALAFLDSAEFRSDTVEAYYTNLLHRTAAPSPAEVSAWVYDGFDLLTIREAFEASEEFRLLANQSGGSAP